MLTIRAPAKLNLTLEVLGKRPDGYHEIRSVIQTITLSDTLRFESGKDIRVSSSLLEWSADKSLVTKAITLLQKTTRTTQGVRIEITKNIPLVAGLGGDSSDAAATLKGLNKLWELGLDCEELTELAAQLGSDVPFFLYGGTALASGRGEVITPLPPFPHCYFILAVSDVPPMPDKTKKLYASLEPTHYSKGEATERLVSALKEGKKINSSLLYNVFDNTTFAVVPELMRKVIFKNVHLAGSGPTLYSMTPDKTRAEKLFGQLGHEGWKIFLAETSNPLETPDRI